MDALVCSNVLGDRGLYGGAKAAYATKTTSAMMPVEFMSALHSPAQAQEVDYESRPRYRYTDTYKLIVITTVLMFALFGAAVFCWSIISSVGSNAPAQPVAAPQQAQQVYTYPRQINANAYTAPVYTYYPSRTVPVQTYGSYAQ